MIKDFKFLQDNKERVFTDYMDQMDDYFLGGIQNNPPYQLSRRHWNLLPQRLRNGPGRDIADYIDGWEARRNNNLNNSHHTDLHRAELWNSGFWDCANRMGTNDQVEELREHFNNTFVEEVREHIRTMFDDEPQVHGFTVGTHNTPLRLEYEGDMDMESVRAMIHDLQYRYMNYVSINEQVIGFMEDYLNEHLNGTSRIRLA
jgi:hypothetical protein